MPIESERTKQCPPFSLNAVIIESIESIFYVPKSLIVLEIFKRPSAVYHLNLIKITKSKIRSARPMSVLLQVFQFKLVCKVFRDR